ncbi:hypothetical protein D3C87_1150520 [compost metagenome]
MRISLFFILIFSLSSLAAGAPVLRLGYENKPRLNGPAPAPLPDVKSYYGETGMALQALNFDSAQSLQEALIPKLNGLVSASDAIFLRYREYLHKNFSAGLSRAQMILIVRDQLPAIVRSYSAQKGIYGNQHFTKIIENAIAGGDRSEFSNYKVFFEFDSEGRFQTHDIEPNRLAVNTGSEVYFNLRDIAQKDSFTLADAVQLWLHEILHSDKSMPLETRDAWGAKVSQWVREQTTEFQVKPGLKIVALSTPEGDFGKMESLGRFPDRDLLASLQDRFLMFEESKQGTKVLRDVYTGFSTLNNSLDPLKDFSGRVIQLPIVTVDKIRKTAQNTLLIEYRQNTVTYQQDYRGIYTKDTTGIGYSGVMNTPGDRYRIEWNIEKSSIDTSRAYSGNLADGDFEIYRVKDVGTKRFITLRVKTQNLKSIQEADSLHLIAKGSQESQLLSFEIKHLRALNQDELLMQVLVPQKSMEISQILLHVTISENAYSEISLRPSKPLVIKGHAEVGIPPIKVQNISVKEKATDQDKVQIRLAMSDAKNITGVTLDLEHEMRTQTYQTGFSGVSRSDTFNFVGLGRKYYLSKSELRVSTDSVSIEVPEIDLTKYQTGPVVTQKISRFYTTTRQDELPYLLDNQRRRIMSVWVHYKDGQVEKVNLNLLPTEMFTLVSSDSMNRLMNAALERARKLQNAQADSPRAPISCEGLF